jgi:protein SCO1/2
VVTSNTQRALVALLAALLAAIGVVLLTSGGGSHQSTGSSFAGPTLPPGVKAPNFTLFDPDGRRVSLTATRGRVVVLTFLHTQCKDSCPLMAEDIKGALNLLPESGRSVSAIAISAQPAEDSPGSRRRFLALHHVTGRLAYLSGPRLALRAVWGGYHVAPVLPGKPDHTAFVLVIDKRGLERLGYPAGQLTPENLAHDIALLEREAA